MCCYDGLRLLIACFRCIITLSIYQFIIIPDLVYRNKNTNRIIVVMYVILLFSVDFKNKRYGR